MVLKLIQGDEGSAGITLGISGGILLDGTLGHLVLLQSEALNYNLSNELFHCSVSFETKDFSVRFRIKL